MINAKTAKETVIRNRKTIITVCAIAGGFVSGASYWIRSWY